MPTPVDIAAARGKMGVLLVGLGAVSTTTIAGVIAVRKGLAKGAKDSWLFGQALVLIEIKALTAEIAEDSRRSQRSPEVRLALNYSLQRTLLRRNNRGRAAISWPRHRRKGRNAALKAPLFNGCVCFSYGDRKTRPHPGTHALTQTCSDETI